MLCAVVAAAEALVAVGGPAVDPPVTVIWLAFAEEVLIPVAGSLAVIVAVALAAAVAPTVTTPSVATVATAAFDELKDSDVAGSGWVEPSL